MKQLVILSGKGGTGKTSITAAFAHLAAEDDTIQAVLADADVDASNFELVLSPHMQEEHEFVGGALAVIDQSRCHHCGTCVQVCRFDAIATVPPAEGGGYWVDEIACEGCAACMYQCSAQAIEMLPQLAGRWFRADSRYGTLFYAALLPAQENSGKLVTLVKQQARLAGLDTNADVVLVDGPPGIGCPVISASAGADLALIVAEPTVSGFHDLERVLETTTHFRVPALVCVNKADIYPEGTQQLHTYCATRDIEVVGDIPFDEAVQQAMVQGEPITAWKPDSSVSIAIVAVWQRILKRLRTEEEG